jgi:hypothetical protein
MLQSFDGRRDKTSADGLRSKIAHPPLFGLPLFITPEAKLGRIVNLAQPVPLHVDVDGKLADSNNKLSKT